MKKLTQLIYATALLCSMAGCNSDPLPKPTQDGANTFGCLIDGKPWIPDGGTGFMPEKPIRGGGLVLTLYPAKKLGIFITCTSKDKREMHIYINNFRTGEYQLNLDTQVIPYAVIPKGDYGLYRSESNLVYVTSSKNIGKITITKSDTLTGVVSGTFEFVAGNSVGSTNITNGRFDVNSATQ
jgi:hypothetical protein